MKTILLGLVVSSILFSNKEHCYAQGNINIEDSILIRWKYDSAGCLSKRSLQDAKYLITKYKLIDKSLIEIESVIGKANLVEEKPGNMYLTYFIGSSCDILGNLKSNYDFCYCRLILRNGRLVDFALSCI